MDVRIEKAGQLYDRAVFSGDASGLADTDRELDAAEAELALARGKLAHLRFLLQRDEDPDGALEDPRELALFERAAQLYRDLGDVRGEGEALFWVGCCQQVVRRDNAAAVPVLDRSLALATEAGDRLVMSEVLRHLGIEAHFGGRPDEARRHLEDSSRLRRELGLLAGVASNETGLAYLAAGQGRRADAAAALAEAAALATATGALRVLASAREARAELQLAEGSGAAD
jgi:tetratricopeptide (TPR) repeat protein